MRGFALVDPAVWAWGMLCVRTTSALASNPSSGTVAATKSSLQLQELDRLTVRVIVDNESDTMSRGLQQVDGFTYLSEKQCQPKALSRAAHGLSLWLKAEWRDEQAKHCQSTIAFDAGPDPDLWTSNAHNMGLDLGDAEAVVLSHYHWDHSGGLRGALPAILAHPTRMKPITVDLHSSTIVRRGRPTPNGGVVPHKPDNPTPEELSTLGANVELHDEPHRLGPFFVSGCIPRISEYEKGIPNHLTLKNGNWILDEEIRDERYVASFVRGRGLVVLSACSHAGIVNVCNHAMEQIGASIQPRKLFGVIGGLHLGGGQMEERIPLTIADLRRLDPDVVLAGHCTGWRAKAQLAADMEGHFQPLAVGAQYVFSGPTEIASTSKS